MFKTEKHQTSKTTKTSDSSLELDSDICKPIKISSSSLQSKAKQRSGQHSTSSTVKTRQGSSEFGDMTVQELENYAVSKSEETSSTVNNCLKIAENIRQDATNTLVALHQQGEQITRTHMVAVKIEQDLTIGEKLLGSLGGLFSKTWKPKKTHGITGPLITKDDSFIRRSSNFNSERESLGLVSKPKGGSKLSQPTTTLDKVEIEKEKQDEALSDLSNIIGQLKGIAVDMNTELDKQNKALDHLHNDVGIGFPNEGCQSKDTPVCSESRTSKDYFVLVLVSNHSLPFVSKHKKSKRQFFVFLLQINKSFCFIPIFHVYNS